MSDEKTSMFRAIEASLQSKPEYLDWFRRVLYEYVSQQRSARDAFAQIEALIEGDEALLAAFRKGPDKWMDPVARVVHVVRSNLPPGPVLDKVMRYISLLIDQLVPTRFFEYLVCQAIADESEAVKQAIVPALKEVGQVQLAMYWRRLRKMMLADGVVDDTVLSADVQPSPLTQFLVMIGLFAKGRQLVTVLNTLDLYGYGLMPEDGMYSMMKSVDEILGAHFDQLAKDRPIGAFFVAPMYDQMKKEVRLATVCRWVLGDEMYELIGKWPDNSKTTTKELVTKMVEDRRKKEDQHPADLGMCVCELQGRTILKGLRAMILSLRLEGEVKEPDEVIRVLGLDPNAERDDIFYRQIFDKCYEKGAEAHKSLTTLINKRMRMCAGSVNDWRAVFKPRLRKGYAVRGLVFVGTSYDLLPNMDEFWGMCERFLSHFSGLDKGLVALKKLFQGGEYDFDESGGLMLWFLGEAINMVHGAERLKEGDLVNIGDLVFTEVSPLAMFQGPIAHIDMVLKRFAVYLRKALRNCPNQFEQAIPIVPNDCFAYHASIKEGKVTVKGYTNPIYIY